MLKPEDRLTYTDEHGSYGLTCVHHSDPALTAAALQAAIHWTGGGAPVGEAVQRLGEYEATGYTPEEIRACMARLEAAVGENSELELYFPNKQSRSLARRGLKLAGYPVRCYTEPDARVLTVRMDME